MKCDICGKWFTYGNRPDGTPNGVGMQFEKGIVNVCADCLMDMKNPETMAKVEKIAERMK